MQKSEKAKFTTNMLAVPRNSFVLVNRLEITIAKINQNKISKTMSMLFVFSYLITTPLPVKFCSQFLEIYF